MAPPESQNQADDAARLRGIFMPHAVRRVEGVATAGTRLVHYTTAAAAMSILQKGEVWLRNTSVMSDFLEVEYGLSCLRAAYRGVAGEGLRNALEEVSPGLCAEFEERFESWIPSLERGTYVVSISEHSDSEDLHGRLSMWRAYGRSSGVAIVLNNAVFLGSSGALGAYSSPVSYYGNEGSEGIAGELQEIAQAIAREVGFLRARGKAEILGHLFVAFMYAVLCTKHPGFHEEREWRVCFVPSLGHPGRIKLEVIDVGGVPQLVAKLPLQNVPSEGLVGLAIPELVERVIIGPTAYPVALYDAFVDILQAAGVPDPHKRVVISEIPLRR